MAFTVSPIVTLQLSESLSPMPVAKRIRTILSSTTPAVWVLGLMCAGSLALILTRPTVKHAGLVFWTFSKNHAEAYAPVLTQWNAEQADPNRQAQVLLLDGNALERRLLSGFMSGTPLSDLMEVERNVVSKTFTGPLEDIGFVDLTDRLRAEGLLDAINAPSFAPWTSRGRIFGIPHDVHPVLLAYRADLVEAAGIDLQKVETWAEFFAAMRPLMADQNNDGRPDRYPLNFWSSNWGNLELLLLQGDGGLFDAQERLTIESERNAFLIATMATWCGGPGRVVVDAPEFTAAGNTLKLRGVVLATLMPDWLAGVWKTDLPDLGGKTKLMPMPAWEKGGRRTSVTGGTMLGIPKTTRDFEAAWTLAKRLYLTPETHAKFFTKTNIIPPLKASWADPVFSAPDPYFCGQPSGQLFIAQAAHVPTRTSSPYNRFAVESVTNVLVALTERANREHISDPAVLLPEARQRLAEAQVTVESLINRNVFLRPASPAVSTP